MKLKQNNLFPGSDWFDINFFEGFASSPSKIKEQLNEQKYKIDDKRLSSRLLNHWYKTGIIDDDRPNSKGWKKFSISELVWIQIVFKLRKFGFDLNRIKLVKNHIDVYNKFDKSSKCLLLDLNIVVAIYSSVPIKLIVFESGQANIVRQVDIDISNQTQMIPEDFIMIDLNKMLDNFFTKKGIGADYFDPLDSKSPLIKQIESSISKDNIQSVTVRVNDKDYLIDEKYLVDNKEKASEIINILEYGELVEKRHKGRSTYEVTNKKKIKRDNP
tara:strand:- start:17 stop:832 length:816 start_codon:yes stop_codon:yes gene_type:complete